MSEICFYQNIARFKTKLLSELPSQLFFNLLDRFKLLVIAIEQVGHELHILVLQFGHRILHCLQVSPIVIDLLTENDLVNENAGKKIKLNQLNLLFHPVVVARHRQHLFFHSLKCFLGNYLVVVAYGSISIFLDSLN